MSEGQGQQAIGVLLRDYERRRAQHIASGVAQLAEDLGRDPPELSPRFLDDIAKAVALEAAIEYGKRLVEHEQTVTTRVHNLLRGLADGEPK